MIHNFFQSRVKIVNEIIFLQKLVQNVAKTFKNCMVGYFIVLHFKP